MLYVYYPNNYQNVNLIRLATLFRLLRLLRIFKHVPQFQRIFVTFIRMLPAASKLFLVLFVVMYTFALLGMQIFGGLITTEGANFIILQNTTFGQSGYYANNFNDMPSGFVTLFELIVVNNWFVIADGFCSVSQLHGYARIYFSAFYLFRVAICFQIVTAFVLDTFQREYRPSGVKVKNAEAVITDEYAEFDATTITGTKTGLHGQYALTAGTSSSLRGRATMHEMMLDMFRSTSGRRSRKPSTVTKAPNS